MVCESFCTCQMAVMIRLCCAGLHQAAEQGHCAPVKGSQGAHRPAGELLTASLHHQARAGRQAAAQPARLKTALRSNAGPAETAS